MLQLGPVALLCQKSYQERGWHDRQKPEKSKVLGGKGSGPKGLSQSSPGSRSVCTQ